MTSLNPVRRVGAQINEAVRQHNPGWTGGQVRDRSIALMEMVGIPSPAWRCRQFPGEFSGGMRQRVMIAIAMANDPDLLIADEPTTALDVTIQAQVMSVLADMRRRTGAAMVLITHDLGLVAENADRIGVMYSGRLAEICPADTIFTEPSHPYTAGLEASLPGLDRDAAELYSIPGNVPDPASRPPGCAFHPRCGLSGGRAICHDAVPALRGTGPAKVAACHFAEETPAWARAQRTALARAAPQAASLPGAATPPPTVLRVEFPGEGVQDTAAFRLQDRDADRAARRDLLHRQGPHAGPGWASPGAASPRSAAPCCACSTRMAATSSSTARRSPSCEAPGCAQAAATFRWSSRTPTRRSIPGCRPMTSSPSRCASTACMRRSGLPRCWTRLGYRTTPARACRRSSPAASGSASPSRAPWHCGRIS